MNTIQYKNLCTIGKQLSSWGLPTFMEHYTNCKKCKYMETKKKINWLRIWQIVRDILVALLTTDMITEKI